MDIPPRKLNNDIQRDIQKKYTNGDIDGSDIFSASWIRCFIRSNHAMDWLFLDNGYNFLWYFSIIIWIVFLSI